MLSRFFIMSISLVVLLVAVGVFIFVLIKLRHPPPDSVKVYSNISHISQRTSPTKNSYRLARVITIREPVRKVKEQPPVTSAEENTAPNNPPAFSGNPTEFFDFIGPYAVELWHRHKILPSVTIAQTAIETGYGKSTIGWNFGGVYACCQSDDVLEDTEILYTIDGYTASAYECPQHPGRYKTLLRTKEWDNNGKGTNLVTVQRWFSYYRSMDEFLERRYKLFTSPIYNNILGERDYIKAANCLTYYAKADVYIPAVIAEIENYSLTDWDKIAFDEER